MIPIRIIAIPILYNKNWIRNYRNLFEMNWNWTEAIWNFKILEMTNSELNSIPITYLNLCPHNIFFLIYDLNVYI